MREFTLYPPPRVRYTQWKDGSIHISVVPAEASALIQSLQRIIGELQQYVVDTLENAKAAESDKLKIPPTRVEILEAELAAAKAAAAAPTLNAMNAALSTYNNPSPAVPAHVQQFRNKADQIEADLRYTPTAVQCSPDNSDVILGPPPDKI